MYKCREKDKVKIRLNADTDLTLRGREKVREAIEQIVGAIDMEELEIFEIEGEVGSVELPHGIIEWEDEV